jgi:probable FeS assembly SUF system protein SufT
MMHGGAYDEIIFTRDCTAIVVPDGNETFVPKGTVAFVMQTLGGNYTIQMSNGYLIRLSGRDADAIGKDIEAPPEAQTDPSGNFVVSEEMLWEQLKLVYDPEIPVNIVELGLIYDLTLEQLSENTYKVAVVMTLTAPGCGMGQVLRDDVEQRVAYTPGVTETHVELVFDPAWSPERMSEAAKLELGFG